MNYLVKKGKNKMYIGCFDKNLVFITYLPTIIQDSESKK